MRRPSAGSDPLDPLSVVIVRSGPWGVVCVAAIMCAGANSAVIRVSIRCDCGRRRRPQFSLGGFLHGLLAELGELSPRCSTCSPLLSCPAFCPAAAFQAKHAV